MNINWICIIVTEKLKRSLDTFGEKMLREKFRIYNMFLYNVSKEQVLIDKRCKGKRFFQSN